MENYHDPRTVQRLNVIELLNDWGFRIVEIRNTLYVVEEFQAAEGDIFYRTTLSGRNITSWVQNNAKTAGFSPSQEREIKDLLLNMPLRHREFHANEIWTEYKAFNGYNL